MKMVWMCKDAMVGLAVVLAKIFGLKSVRYRGFVTRNWMETTAVKEMTRRGRYVSAYRRFGRLKIEKKEARKMIDTEATIGLNPEILAEIEEKMRKGCFADLATAIFRPFRVHGVIYGKMSLHMLEQFSERLIYEVGQLSRKDIYSYAQVTLRRNWMGSVYIHYRLPDKKALNFGYYLFQMEQGRLERFDESLLGRVKTELEKFEVDDLTLDTIKRLSKSPILREILEKVWNAGYEDGFLDGEVGV